ncbi:MAG: hypothetical protein WCJ11_02035 [Methylococcaceae bacterium]
MNGYEKLLKELLLKYGCKFLRSGKGSHEIWICPNGVSVAVNHTCKSRHTANSILKDALVLHTVFKQNPKPFPTVALI